MEWANGMGHEKKIAVSFFVLLLVVFSAELFSGERRGADLKIFQRDGSQTTGELIAVRKNSLLLLDSSSAVDVSIDVQDIKNIEIIKKSKTVLGLCLGGAVGGVAAYGGSYLAWNFEKKETWAVAGAVVGMVVGAMIGSALSDPETIRIESVSAEKTRDILMRLQSQARLTERK